MRLCLVEDSAVTALEPLSLTRPVFDLVLGSRSLGQKSAQAFGIDWHSSRRGALIRPHLVEPLKAKAPRSAVNDARWLTRGPVLVVNARWVPSADFQVPKIRRPTVGTCGGQVACAWVGPGQALGLEPARVDDWFEAMANGLDAVDVDGEWIERPSDLLDRNAKHLTRDFAASQKVGRGHRGLGQGDLVGPSDRLYIHPTAQIDPYSVFDTRGGPIAIEAGVVIQGFSQIEGPCSIGEHSQLNHAKIRSGVTIGPHCRIRGEVEQSIVHGHFHHHDGLLRHAYVDEWYHQRAITSQNGHEKAISKSASKPVGIADDSRLGPWPIAEVRH